MFYLSSVILFLTSWSCIENGKKIALFNGALKNWFNRHPFSLIFWRFIVNRETLEFHVIGKEGFLAPNEIVYSKFNEKGIQRFTIHIDLENQLLTIVKSTWVYCIPIMAKSHTATSYHY
jgi:hypothetical protein